jgi:hypothetical protein
MPETLQWQTRLPNPTLAVALMFREPPKFMCPRCRAVHMPSPMMLRHPDVDHVWTCTCGAVLRVPKATE